MPGQGMITLVLGGARSGKSVYAETLALSRPGPRYYLATAEVYDSEMAERVRVHQQRRGEGVGGPIPVAGGWITVEEPLDLAGALRRHGAAPGVTVLVDCLTLWLSNLMAGERDIDAETAGLLAACDGLGGFVIFVASEVGLGIVPDNALARAFRDHAGRLNQAVAARADRVVFVAAGLPLTLKP